MNHFHRSIASTNYVSEMDLIREVLFMLSGAPGYVFQQTAAAASCQVGIIICDSWTGLCLI